MTTLFGHGNNLTDAEIQSVSDWTQNSKLMESNKINSVIVRGGGLKGSTDPERNTCPMKLGKGSSSSPDRHRVKTGTIYQEYVSINRLGSNENDNNNYNFRPKITKAICNKYTGSRHDIRPTKNKNTINSYTSETHISAQRDFDDFNENFLDMAIDKLINNYLDDYIKDIEESQQEVPSFSCGKCKKYFNDRHSHFINSPKCINHDTLCSICNTFFCGTKGLNIHFIFRHQGKSMNRFTIPIQPVPFDSEVDQAVLDEETNNHGDGIPEETNEDFSLNTHGTHMEDERDNGDDNEGNGNGDDRGDDGNDGNEDGGDDNDNNNEGNENDEGEDDDDKVHIKKCNSNRNCLTCPVFEPRNNISSTVTSRSYEVKNHDFPSFCDCSSSNVIYLLSCTHCSLQYVGQTGRRLRNRVTEHRNNISKGNSSSPFLTKHFRSQPCLGAKFSISILEKLPGSGLTARNIVDSSKVAFRRERESYWILKLRTVFPYGMNHDTGKHQPQGDTVIGKIFPKLSSKNRRSPSQTRNYRNVISNFDTGTFLSSIDETLGNDIKNAPHNFRKDIYSLKKAQLKSLANELNNLHNNRFNQWYNMIVDMIETKLYTPPIKKPKKKISKYQINLPFKSKAFDFINLSKIIRTSSSIDVFPNDISKENLPMVTCSLSEPIRSKIFNYSQFVSSLKLDEVFNDINTIPCNCRSYEQKYLDPHHQHIITGDLSFIQNELLSRLIKKGPKYREPCTIDLDNALVQIKSSLNICIEKMISDSGLNKQHFLPWYHEIIKLVSEKIVNIKIRFQEKNISNVLDDPHVKTCLQKLHDEFVLCPTDKAANNVSIICKQHYAKIIMDELNLHDINNPNNTYERIYTNKETIIQNHILFQSRFGLAPALDMQNLPPLHWTPKIHKSPTSSRFIIGSKKSSLKPLGKAITKIFKLIFNFKRSYFRKAGFFSGLKHFWCVENQNEVVDALDRLSKKKNAKSISTFDFSTLYTKIPHDKLIQVLTNIVETTFNDNNRKLISVGKKKAYWVKGFSKTKHKFNVQEVKECFSFLTNNAYFRVGDAIFRQKIGIPMGSDPAPFFANLFLFHYESKWIKTHSRTEFLRARRLFNIFRYIDDLLALNDGNEFLRTFNEIYPSELVLNKENPDSNTEASFLALDISIVENQFKYKLYDKRNAFPFHIIRFPHKNSNIPHRMFYSPIAAEVLRICRVSSDSDSFRQACIPFLNRMAKQGATKDGARKSINKIIATHFGEFSKFNLQREQLVNLILDMITH